MKTFSISKILFTLLLSLCLYTNLSAQTWQQVGGGMNDGINVLMTDPAANVLYAGGRFTYAGNTFAPFIAKWNGTAWSALGSGMNGPVYAMCMHNGELYAGGKFTSAGGVSCKNIAKWNGTTWSALDSGTEDGVYALISYQGNLHVGGVFTYCGTTSTGCLAKWDGTSWWRVGGTGFVPDAVGYDNGISSFKIYKNKLYIGGKYKNNGSFVNSLYKWDGFVMTPISTYNILSLEIYNNLLLIMGSWIEFYDGNGSTVTCLRGANRIFTSTLFENKLVFAGSDEDLTGCNTGSSLNAGSYVSTYDGTNFNALGVINNMVWASAVYNNKLYIGGDFTNVSGSQTDNIASISSLVATENTPENAYDIKVLDNPNSTGIFTIQTNAPSEVFPIRTEVSDISGKIIAKNRFSDNNILINIENNTAGFYVLTLLDKNNQKIGTQKLVISK